MNTSLATFLKIAVTVLAIGAFLFVFGYNMTKSQVDKYEEKITNVESTTPPSSYTGS